MVRILYGVAGEGLGHATRAKAILEQLRGHQVTLVSSSRAYLYLRRFFPRVNRIFGFHIVYWNNRVSNLGMFIYNFVRMPLLVYGFLRTFLLALTLRPSIIITDYEPFTCYTGIFLGIPVLSVNNQHLLNRAWIRHSRRHRWEAFKTRFANTLLIPTARHYFITSFSRHPVAARTTLVAPLLRKELQRLQPTIGKHVLVYQTSRSNKKLLELLRLLPERFIVYGFGSRKGTAHVTFKTFDEQAFFHDLATCKAVITNGGYSLISEAIMLGKPVLAEPVRKQFEQQLNALLLAQEGYGCCVKRITVENLIRFLQQLGSYRERLQPLERVDKNEGVVAVAAGIEQLILQASSGARQSFVPRPSRGGWTSPSRLRH
ncbi:MAG TPA: glycosyltransferase family protein [Candidatus Binatia bacterium]|nr:glycosyltransferase family protein [Candidatus Binatia bacterium]